MYNNGRGMFKTTIDEDTPRSPGILCKVKQEPDIEHSEELNDLVYEDAEFDNRCDFKTKETENIEHSNEPSYLIHSNNIDFDNDKIKIEEIYIKSECFTDELIDDVCSQKEIIREEDYNNQNKPNESCSSPQVENVNGTITNEQSCFEMSENETDKPDMNQKDDEHQTNINKEIRKVKRYAHTNGKPYVCDVCNKVFAYARYLTQHKLIHTGYKPFVCNVCNKGFTRSTDLTRHNLTHSGVKSYACDVCNQMFARSGNLRQHKLTHTGDKPYVCDVCNKDFLRSTDLDRHKHTHTGEKPYVCDICNKMFARSGNLIQHKNIHTGKKSYTCDVCNKIFRHLSSFKRHKLIHTGNKL